MASRFWIGGVGEVENGSDIDNYDNVDSIDGGQDNSTLKGALKTFRVGWYYSAKEHVDIATRMVCRGSR